MRDTGLRRELDEAVNMEKMSARAFVSGRQIMPHPRPHPRPQPKKGLKVVIHAFSMSGLKYVRNVAGDLHVPFSIDTEP